MSARIVAVAVLTSALTAFACAGKVKPPPPPLRPEPRVFEKKTQQTRLDCEDIATHDGPPPLTYEERSIEEAENLANQGFEMLQQAEDREIGQAQAERLIEQAVHRFITALLADPYNVHATYNLAAAYARIGRSQCAINLLARLVPLRKMASLSDEVEKKLDRLLGRKSYKGRLDPDFFDLRDDPRFRELAKSF